MRLAQDRSYFHVSIRRGPIETSFVVELSHMIHPNRWQEIPRREVVAQLKHRIICGDGSQIIFISEEPF